MTDQNKIRNFSIIAHIDMENPSPARAEALSGDPFI